MRAYGAFIVCCVILAVIPAQAEPVTTDPANGHITRPVDARYGTPGYGYPRDWTRDDMSFGSLYPSAAELVSWERYMLAGTLGKTRGSGNGLPGWITLVEAFCLDYYSRFNNLPDRITTEVVESLRGRSITSLPAEDRAILFNPATGEPPRVNARLFSPGDIYLRPLRYEELDLFASERPELYNAWFRGVYIDPATGNEGAVELLSDVFYIRAYGRHGVIYESLAYKLSKPDYNRDPEPNVVTESEPEEEEDDDERDWF